MRKKLLLLSILLSASYFLKAQDPSFSQYYGNPLYLNPALTGSKICPRLTLNYRNQWPSIPGTFVNYAASYDRYIDPISGGIGIMVVAEDIAKGIVKSTQVSGLYAFRTDLSKKTTMTVGFQATYIQNKLNWDKLIFADQLEGIQPGSGGSIPLSNEPIADRLTASMIDFSTGVVIAYQERIYAGLAVNHLSQPDNSFYSNGESRLDMKVTAHAGALIGINSYGSQVDVEDLSLAPNIMYQQQGKFRQMNLGLYLNMYPFVVGAWYRHAFENPDAVIALLGFMTQKFKVGYSYDYTVSRLTNATGGAHEVSFTWQFDCPQKTFKHKAIKCPRF